MNSKNCIHCSIEIPAPRKLALPNTKTCVACSKAGRMAGFPVISGKTTYSELQILPQELATDLYAKQERIGGIGEGVKFKDLPKPKTTNFE